MNNHQIPFDELDYYFKIQSKSTRAAAISSLEFAIKRAQPKQGFELHKLRTPGIITKMELDTLKKAGFPVDKLTPDGEYEILVLAYKAGANHAGKYWNKNVAEYYNMDSYKLSEAEK